ncbi:uracil-DNA glycosylase [Polynucleobacter sp. AM-26B4]|uniref:uracil-DNA glycosylase n=1 Tax=Polynucleobacter sp. AM-26B4 TaxID=2689103 RepID=UPI001C0B3548|nr:uracil-DNA glycosylase [Polynucleobacter sp. AM-26B4]
MPSLFSIKASLPGDWLELIHDELASGRFERLEREVSSIYSQHAEELAPSLDNIFRAFKETSVEQTKVIILGQDPYQTPGLAQGLSFSIPKEIKPGWRAFPSSLRNISKALALDGYQALPHGDLSAWAAQGVLLLNATLTVQLNLAGSHAQLGWQDLTDVLLYQLAKKKSLIWMLWGAHAQKKLALIEEASQESGVKQEILTASHPSGLSVYKTKEPFIYPGDQQSCGHFRKANELLLQRSLKPIEWLVPS